MLAFITLAIRIYFYFILLGLIQTYEALASCGQLEWECTLYSHLFFMSQKFPYGICKIAVGNNDKFMQCDQCDKWNHITAKKLALKNMKNLNMTLYYSFVQPA